MNMFNKTLLAGAAICALASAPALASHAPNIHLAGVKTAVKMTVTGISHNKTNIVDKKSYTNYTTTISLAGSLTESVYYKNPVLLYAYDWIEDCTQPANQKFKITTKPTAGKAKAGSSTGTRSSCGSTVFTYLGPVYELKSKTATSDSLVGQLAAKHTSSGYNLTANFPTSLTITH